MKMKFAKTGSVKFRARRQQPVKSRVTGSGRVRSLIEQLEPRKLLSAAVLQAVPANAATFSALATAGSASPTTGNASGSLSPETIRNAYGLDSGSTNAITIDGISGTGAGQTIAIVDAQDDPALVSSTASNFSSSDLAMFDSYYGLPNPPSFKKVDEFGSTTSFPASGETEPDSGWANEEALDVEWTHAIAPQANILLVEAYSDTVYPSGTSDLLNTAVKYAADQPGVSVVTMSFAVPEFSGETGYDSNVFQTPSGHAPVTFVAASGDISTASPGPVFYPAASPNVVSVGGATLTVNGSGTSATYGSESAVNISGGGVSTYEAKPSYQFGVTQSSTNRTVPDVAFDGDKLTGFSVYDSYNGGTSTPWYKVGGTSIAAPAWAGLIAIANQGRASYGLSALNGATQTLPELYELNSNAFHDITTGANSTYSAGSGYDLVTGRGSPVAGTLIPDLVGNASVSGTIFSDTNGNGTQQSGEADLVGWGAFIDLYGTGVREGADPYALSNGSGVYTITGIPAGTYHLTQGTVSGYTRTAPTTYYTETFSVGQTITGQNIADKPVVTTGSISGTVFSDNNGNGTLDSGEPGLSGWGVFIDYNHDGVFDDSDVRVFTNSSGAYSFPSLAAGTYYINEAVPAGYTRTGVTTAGYTVTVTAGGAVAGKNFGNAPDTASVSGVVFNDANGDGIQDDGEAGLSGWGVFIDYNDDHAFDGGDIRIYTNANGTYTFAGLEPGTYHFNEAVPTGYKRTAVATTGYTFTVVAGQSITGAIFGNEFIG
jgi:subtilase family serine protease